MSLLGSRRDVLRLMGVGGVVFASGLAGAAGKKKKSSHDSDFFFVGPAKRFVKKEPLQFLIVIV